MWSLDRLHAKLAVIDNRFLFIFSMNIDFHLGVLEHLNGPRNRQPQLAEEMSSLLKR